MKELIIKKGDKEIALVDKYDIIEALSNKLDKDAEISYNDLVDKPTSLKDIDVIDIVGTLSTASTDTMNKLYLVAENTDESNNNYEIYITVENNGNYAWERVDSAKIDLSTKADVVHTHGNLQNDGKVGTTNNATKNVVTDQNGKITTEDKYTHPSYTARTGKPTANQTPAFGGTATVSQITSDASGHVTGATDRTIKIPNNLGNGTTAGLSTNDYTTTEKNKLAGVDSEANKTTVDSSLSESSTNPVQNKVINSALNNKSKVSFTQTKTSGIEIGKITIDGVETAIYQQDNNTTYSAATQSANGLMSSSDKTKLDGIATGANKTTVDSALSSTSTNPVQNKVINTALDAKATKDTATQSANGLMSSSDKTKLDGIATGANKITVDSALSSTSTNPVQNKVVNSALGNKSKVSFTQTKTSGIEIGKINIDGTETSIYQQDNNTTYTPASETPKNDSISGTVGTSAKYAREDHQHPHFDFTAQGTDRTAGYVKALKIEVKQPYQDIPIVFTILQRDRVERCVFQCKFDNANSSDPGFTNQSQITHSGMNIPIYLYKESAGVWNLICGKGHNNQYGYMKIQVDNPNSNIEITKIDTHLAELPENTTTNPLKQSTFVGFTSTEKTKLAGIETGANKTVVDSALDGTSTRPVQNKVIKEKIDTLATKDEIDSITAGNVTLTGYVKQSDIQNNLTSTDTNKPLSAAQGKALNTSIGTKTVTVEKLTTATSGYAASYVVKQNGSQVGATINIPKDFLVKSASVKSCTTANNPVSGYKVGDKYLDFVVNTDNVDGVADSHLYILVSELVDVYAADGSSIELYSDNGVQKFRVKDGGITIAKLADKANMVTEYIVGTQTGSTSAWTGTSTKISSLAAGQVIFYKLPYASTSTAVTLNLTLANGSTTGAKEVWFWNGARLTTHYSVNSVVGLVYNGTQWWVINPSNNNNNYYLVAAEYITTGEAISSGGLMACKKEDGKYYNLSSLANNVIDITRPIFGANGNLSSGASGNGVQVWNPWLNITVTKSGFSGTAYKPVYIEGIQYSNGRFVVSTNYITQTLTKGNFYIHIGQLYNATSIGLNLLDQKVLYYDGTNLIPVNNIDGENGGTNLIPNTKAFGDISTGALTGESYKGCAIRRFNNTNGTTYMDCTWNLPKVGDFTYGDKFTLSFWAKGTGQIICYSYGYSNYVTTKPIKHNGSASGTGYGDGTTTFPLTNEWRRYYVTWVLNPTAASNCDDSVLKRLLIRTSTGSDSYVAGPMFERGDVAHDWSPAPEDKSDATHNHDGTYIKTGTGTVTSTNILDKTIVNGDIADATIETGKIKDSAITSAKIADKTIVNGDIADTTIQGGKLVSGTITATQLASNAVETAKIKDSNVTTAKIADSNVTTAKIADSNVTTAKIADSAVTSAKIADGTIVNADVASNAAIAYSKLSGVAPTTHTHHDTDLDWNGVALANKVSPVDMAMYEEFSANRLAYLSGDNIIVEYSTDNGSTWTETATDATGKANKVKLVTTQAGFTGGNGATKSANNQVRITLKAGNANQNSAIYLATRKFMIYFSTGGSSGCKCKVDYSTYGTPTTWTTLGTYTIDGYSGWNSIPVSLTWGGFGSQCTGTRVQNIRFTFNCTTIGSANINVQKIRAFGESCWNFPSTLATTGHIYTFDENQNATFPGKIIKSGGTSAQFLKADGSVDGTTYVSGAGTGLTKDGANLKHSNSVTADTTGNFKKLKYDAQGHITGAVDVAKTDITSLGIPAQDTVYTHPNSGVTAGTNYNGNQEPAFGATFNIPKLTFNAQGHITASANSTVKIPALPTGSTQQAGILQLGTGSGNAATGNHTHSYLPLSGGTLTGAVSSSKNITTTGTVEAATIKKTSGTSSQFLKADGSVDSNTYSTTSHTHNNVVTQTVPSNADLNNYKTVGVYKNNSNANVATMSNTPWQTAPPSSGSGTGQAFVMIVLDHAGFTQIIRPFHPTDYNIWIRNFYNNTWGVWKKVYTNGNLTKADITALGITGADIKIDSTTNEDIATILNGLSSTYAHISHEHGNIDENGVISGQVSKNVVTDANGKITTEAKYSHPSYTARTGVPTQDYNLSFGGRFNVSQPVSDASGHITAINGRWYTLPALPTADTSTAGITKLVDDLTTGGTDKALTAEQGKTLNNKITAITSANASITNLTSIQTSGWSGTIKYMVRNGWCTVIFEDLKKTSTTTSYDNIVAIPVNNDTQSLVYGYSNLTNSPVVARISSQGNLTARCITANTGVYGHIVFPCSI